MAVRALTRQGEGSGVERAPIGIAIAGWVIALVIAGWVAQRQLVRGLFPRGREVTVRSCIIGP